MAATKPRRRNPSRLLLQNTNDVLFGKSAALRCRPALSCRASLFLATNSNQLNEARPSIALGLQMLKRATIDELNRCMARKLRQKPRLRLLKRHLSLRSSPTKEMQIASVRQRVREYLDNSGAIIMCD